MVGAREREGMRGAIGGIQDPEREVVALIGADHGEAARELALNDLAAERRGEIAGRGSRRPVRQLVLDVADGEHRAVRHAVVARPDVHRVALQPEIRAVLDRRFHREPHSPGDGRPGIARPREVKRDRLRVPVRVDAARVREEPTERLAPRNELERSPALEHLRTHPPCAEGREEEPADARAVVDGAAEDAAARGEQGGD